MRAFLDRKGHADHGVTVDFGDDLDESLVWKTMRPPRWYWRGDDVWNELLERKRWIKSNGWLELPAALTAPAGHGDWRALEAQPDERIWNKVSKCFSPISRIADHLVCCAWKDAALQPMMLTHRQKTQIRLNLTTYKKRSFVDDRFEEG